MNRTGVLLNNNTGSGDGNGVASGDGAIRFLPCSSVFKAFFCVRRAAAAAFICGLLFTLACAGPRQNVDPAPQEEAKGFMLVVINHHLLDVNIFLLHDGQADRISMVNAASSRTQEMPLYMLGQGGTIRLIAEPIGSDSRYTTDLLTVQPGQVVELSVENPLARSTYSIQ